MRKQIMWSDEVLETAVWNLANITVIELNTMVVRHRRG